MNRVEFDRKVAVVKEQAINQKIKTYMQQEITNHIDQKTNEANLTAMAEDAIDILAGDNWEDWHEEGHIVWDIAVDVSDEMGFGVRI